MADPTVVTFHNRGRAYRRWRIADAADRCDWIAFSDDIVAEAIDQRTRAGRSRLWFPRECAPIPSGVYARQRSLFERVEAGEVDGGEAEEQALLLLDCAMSAAAPLPPTTLRRTDFDAVQHVREIIAASPAAAVSLRRLAHRAAMSPFQLCRAFHRVTGETITSYRLRLRLLSSLERLRAGGAITDIALAHGFSSHSHFTAAFSRAFGMPPTRWKSG